MARGYRVSPEREDLRGGTAGAQVHLETRAVLKHSPDSKLARHNGGGKRRHEAHDARALAGHLRRQACARAPGTARRRRQAAPPRPERQFPPPSLAKQASRTKVSAVAREVGVGSPEAVPPHRDPLLDQVLLPA